MGLIHDDTREVITDDKAQDLIRQTIERTGVFIMAASVMPPIGEIREFAGLPLRVVRHVEKEEALLDMQRTADLWGYVANEGDSYFEVEVAD